MHLFNKMLIKTLLLKALLMVSVTSEFMEGYQSGQMGRAVNPLTSVFESSNLSPSTRLKMFNSIKERGKFGLCGCSSVVEH